MNLHILLRAPVSTPSPLCDVYEAVAKAVSVAIGLHREASSNWCGYDVFKGGADALAHARRVAYEALDREESLLRRNAPGLRTACHAALEAVEPINHACSHVIASPTTSAAQHMGWDFKPCNGKCGSDGDPQAYFAALPTVDEQVILERMREAIAAAATPMPPAPEPHAKTGEQRQLSQEAGEKKVETTGMTWQEAARRLEQKRSQGEPWTSYEKMAGQIGCSRGNVHRAVRETPELSKWAKRQAAPRVHNLNETVIDRGQIADKRESDPQDDAAEAELRKAVEEADSDERAFLHSIRGASRDYQLWYIQQTKSDQKKHRTAWKEIIEPDPTVRTWFLELSLEEKLETLNDTGKHQKSFHTS